MKIRLYRVRVGEVLIALLFILIIFGDYLSSNFNSAISYADEFLVIIVALYAISKLIRAPKQLSSKEYLMLITIALLVIVGVVGNLITHYQSSTFAIMVDMLGWQKFFLTYISFLVIIKPSKSFTYFKISEYITKFILLIGLTLAVFNLLSIINLTEGYDRFGFHAFSFYGHPSSSAATFAAMACLLEYNEKENRVWIAISLLLAVLTFRFKAIAFVAFFIYLRFFSKKKFSIWKLIVAAIGIIFIAWDQIEFYFLSLGSRSILLTTAINIAGDLFPIGSGFGTYGTAMSGQFYSKAYVIYGLSRKYGMTSGNYTRVGDGGIASIVAQFGFIGILFFAILLTLLLKTVLHRIKSTNNIVPYIALIGYLMISQTNEGAFNSAFAPLFAFTLALLIKCYEYSTFSRLNHLNTCEGAKIEKPKSKECS